MEIFETENQVLGMGPQHDPFGFDPEGRAKFIDTIYKQFPSHDEIINKMYHEQAISFCKELRLEAALVKLAKGKPVAIEKPDTFKEILEREWTEMSVKLAPERAKISKERLAHWQMHN